MLDKTKIMSIVSSICSTETTDCRGLNLISLATKLLNLGGIPSTYIIREIPVSLEDQVVVLFTIPNDKNYYSLFTGIGKDGIFYYEYTIAGKIISKTKDKIEFEFYDTEIQLNSWYWELYKTYFLKEV